MGYKRVRKLFALDVALVFMALAAALVPALSAMGIDRRGVGLCNEVEVEGCSTKQGEEV
jgi:hypothetical protein